MLYIHDVNEEIQIFKVDPWTRTPILANIEALAVPISMYVLIETHIKGVPAPSQTNQRCY